MGRMPTHSDSVGAGGGFGVRKKVDPKGAPTAPDLHLTTGNPLVLKKAARVVCKAWALCGANLVDHRIEKAGDGTPKKIRNIYVSQAQRNLWTVAPARRRLSLGCWTGAARPEAKRAPSMPRACHGERL